MLSTLKKEFKFLLAIWKTNLLSAMEYRAAFLTQTIGMMLNNFMYFAIWIIFFQRFKDVRGWGIGDMATTYGILASSFGFMCLFFGNAFNLAEVINKGRLDYYLSLPRPVLLHTVASRMIASGMGDFSYGFVSFAFQAVSPGSACCVSVSLSFWLAPSLRRFLFSYKAWLFGSA